MANFIFDFDGTIADSFDYVMDYLAKEIQGPESRARKHHGAYRGLSMRLIAVKLGAPAWRLPFLFLKGRKQMGQGLAQIDVFEGVAEQIKYLHDNGHKVFLVSVNLKQNITPFLKTHQLDQYFIDVYGSASIFGKTPVLKRLISHYKLDKSETWYVGDEGSDVRAAHKAGIKAAAVTWGYNNLARLKAQRPDAMIFSADEISILAPKA